MGSRNRLAAGLLVCAILASGCGKKEPAAGSGPLGPAIASLIPEGTAAVLHIPNPKRLEERLRRVLAAADPKVLAKANLSELAQEMVGLGAADLDLDRPVTVALTGVAGVTAILPVRDEKATAAKVQASSPGAVVETGGGFVAVTRGSYERGGLPPRLSAPLLAGDLVLRLDVASLAKTLGPMAFARAEEMLSTLEESGLRFEVAATDVKELLGDLKKRIGACSTLDLALRIDGTSVEIETVVVFTNPEAVPMALFPKADVATLARSVPDGGLLSLATPADLGLVMEATMRLMDGSLRAMPLADRKRFEALFDGFRELAPTLWPGTAASESFGPDGLVIVAVANAKDPHVFVSRVNVLYEIFNAEDSFVSVGLLRTHTVDGATVSTRKLRFDPDKLGATGPEVSAHDRAMIAKMFGNEGIDSSIVLLGNRVMLVMGNDDLLERAIGAAKVDSPNALSKAVVASGEDMVAYLSFDQARMMNEAREALGLENRETAPVPLVIILNAGPDRLRVRMSADVGTFMKFVNDATPK